MAGIDIIVEKMLFILCLLALTGLTLWKVYNIMKLGRENSFISVIILAVLSWLSFGICFALYLTMAEELAILSLFRLATMVLGLNTLAFVVEIILLVVSAGQSHIRDRYTPLNYK